MQIVVGLAGGDDPEPGIGIRKHDVVQIVLAGISLGDLEPPGVERALHFQRFGLDVHAEIHARLEGLAVEVQIRRHELQAIGRNFGRAPAVRDVGHHLEAHPQAREPRHLIAVQTQIQDLLGVARIQRRHADVKQHRLRLTAQGRRLAAGIVADDRQHPAVLVDAGVIGVLQGVARSVDARGLAIPHAGHAIELLATDCVEHLGAPHRRRRKILVEAVDEMDVVLDQQLLLLDEGCIEHAHR